MICPKCSSIFYFIIESGSEIAKCRDCGYRAVYVKPKYEGYVHEKYGNTVGRNEETDPLLRKMLDVLYIKKDDLVLDFGCGSGDYVNVFKKFSKKVIGVDSDISLAKKKYPNLNFKKQNGERLNFAMNSIDKIVCVNTIEHIVNYYGLLQNFFRVVKSGGQIFITTYDRNFLLHKLNFDSTHLIEWSVDEFVDLVESFFVVKRVFKTGIFFNYYPCNNLLVNFLKPEVCVLAEKK